MVMTRMGEESKLHKSSSLSKYDKFITEHYSNSKYVSFNESQYQLLDEGIKEAIGKWQKWITIKNMQMMIKSPAYKPYIASKGDYTKVKDLYPNYKKVLDYLKANMKNSDREAIQILVDMDKQMKAKTKLFKSFFKMNNKEVASLQFIYVSAASALFYATTYVAERLIEVEEDQRGEFVRFKLKEKSNDTIANAPILNQVKTLSENFRKGALERAVDEISGKKNESFLATAALYAVGVLTLFITARVVILQVYMLRVKIADRLRVTAEILTNNASTLADKKVAQKQRDAADKFRLWADKLDVEDNTASNKAERESSKMDAEAGKLAMQGNETDDQSSGEDSGDISGMLM